MMHRPPRGTAGRRSRPAHPWPVRLCHWLGAIAMIMMIMSGWQIYNASPLLPFRFSRSITLGGWLGGAIAWHLAAMWLLLASGLGYLAYGLLSGHFRRDLLPITPGAVGRDLLAALTFRLEHRSGSYNAVQKLMYAGVLLVATLTVLTGFSIWKPVQLHYLTGLFGGYDVARALHFTGMSLIVAFLVVHLTLVLIVPSTLLGMLTGGRRETALHGSERP